MLQSFSMSSRLGHGEVQANYASLVKRIRDTLLLTQMELADELGVAYATVNRWEKGHHEPTMRQKRAIRDYCQANNLDFVVKEAN